MFVKIDDDSQTNQHIFLIVLLNQVQHQHQNRINMFAGCVRVLESMNHLQHGLSDLKEYNVLKPKFLQQQNCNHLHLLNGTFRMELTWCGI